MHIWSKFMELNHCPNKFKFTCAVHFWNVWNLNCVMFVLTFKQFNVQKPYTLRRLQQTLSSILIAVYWDHWIHISSGTIYTVNVYFTNVIGMNILKDRQASESRSIPYTLFSSISKLIDKMRTLLFVTPLSLNIVHRGNEEVLFLKKDKFHFWNFKNVNKYWLIDDPRMKFFLRLQVNLTFYFLLFLEAHRSFK